MTLWHTGCKKKTQKTEAWFTFEMQTQVQVHVNIEEENASARKIKTFPLSCAWLVLAFKFHK